MTSEDCSVEMKHPPQREISSNAQKRSDRIHFFFQIGQNCLKNTMVQPVFTLGEMFIFSKSGILYVENEKCGQSEEIK